MKGRFLFLEERSIVVQWFRGALTADDILEVHAAVESQPWMDRVARAVSDYREATADFDAEGLRHIAREHATRGWILARLPAALLIDGRKETALGMLFSTLRRDDRENHVFSTTAGAAPWLGLPAEELDSAITRLRNAE